MTTFSDMRFINNLETNWADEVTHEIIAGRIDGEVFPLLRWTTRIHHIEISRQSQTGGGGIEIGLKVDQRPGESRGIRFDRTRENDE